MSLKNRSWNVTVQYGHQRWDCWLVELSKQFDEGNVEYAAVSLEKAKKGTIHLQGFVVFHESADSRPSEYLLGHWTKARSLSGSRDYCVRRGIHIEKEGVIRTFEFGHWVDPAWNQGIRSRTAYEFGRRIANGSSVVDLAIENPAGVLLIGESNLANLVSLRGRMGSVNANTPYYYIECLQLMDEVLKYQEITSAQEEE